MSGETTTTTSQTQTQPTPAAAPPQPVAPGADGGTDYKAMYEELKRESRKWEERAKENKAKADAYDASQQQAKTVEQQLSELQTQFRAAQVENTRLRVAQEKGVPAALLRGGTEDEMEAFADELVKFAGAQVASSVVVGTDGNSAQVEPKKSNEDILYDFIQKQL